MAQNEGGTTGELHYTCDCDTAFDSLEKYAGKFCQYTSTDICTKNGQPGMGKANFAFCVNNGVCKGKINDGEDPPECTCPDRFYGDHCEYLETEEDEHFDGGYDDDGDYDGGYADDDYANLGYTQTQTQETSQSSKFVVNGRGVLTGLSAAVILIVLIFVVVVARALLNAGSSGTKSADIQAAVTEEESAAGYNSNTSGIIHSSSGDGSLEDIEVDDYVNNHTTVLTDKEMTNVQLV
jgi:hypothetical protein